MAEAYKQAAACGDVLFLSGSDSGRLLAYSVKQQSREQLMRSQLSSISPIVAVSLPPKSTAAQTNQPTKQSKSKERGGGGGDRVDNAIFPEVNGVGKFTTTEPVARGYRLWRG